jgi:hypothetical protein
VNAEFVVRLKLGDNYNPTGEETWQIGLKFVWRGVEKVGYEAGAEDPAPGRSHMRTFTHPRGLGIFVEQRTATGYVDFPLEANFRTFEDLMNYLAREYRKVQETPADQLEPSGPVAKRFTPNN